MATRLQRIARWLRRKPRILLLLDYRGWAFDNSAQEIARELADEFDFEFRYKHDSPQPKLKPWKYDLIYVFFWGETYHQQFGFDPARTMKEISSHRWLDDPRLGPCTDAEMVQRHLSDADTFLCTSQRLCNVVQPHRSRVFHTPNGINTKNFCRLEDRTGRLLVGWAGNIEDSVKGVNDILRPACEGRFDLLIADGSLSHDEMNLFYNKLDVFAVASLHEGEPLTLVEAMAAGCFPVCTDVGVVPEMIIHKKNGLIVEERTPEAFRHAFDWCRARPEIVRAAGAENAATFAKERSWARTAKYFRRVFLDTLDYANRVECRKSSRSR